MSTLEDKIYTAGIIDGEGCISIGCKKGKEYALNVQVVNTNYDLMEYLKKIWGGGIAKHTTDMEKWKDSYMWTLSLTNLSRFLKEIIPYLKLRKKQAEIGIKFRTYKNMRKVDSERKSLYLQMRTLNKNGN